MLDQVLEIIEKNQKDIRVESLEDYASEIAEEDTKREFENVVGQDSLTRFDQPKKKRKSKSRKKRPAKRIAKKRE